MSIQKAGCWVARDTLGEIVYPFADEIDALRHVQREGYYLEVLFVPWGEDATNFKPNGQPSAPAMRGPEGS